ncbi:hypothetical protein EMPS_07229 [Entomortierella parvispora]|uniref:Uncharacterized protein n=1 Tax=Entomortierella parvispora TaxID=205924 RepID=A0A9P3HDQ8_9FUNG|nr:hypothetical protein EMPS_07229 [Entomortierella parvispora]
MGQDLRSSEALASEGSRGSIALIFDLTKSAHSGNPTSGADDIPTNYPWVHQRPEMQPKTRGLYFKASEKDPGLNDMRPLDVPFQIPQTYIQRTENNKSQTACEI